MIAVRPGLGVKSEVVFVLLLDEILVEVEVEAVTAVMIEGEMMANAVRMVLEAEKAVSLQNCLSHHVSALQAEVVEEEEQPHLWIEAPADIVQMV